MQAPDGSVGAPITQPEANDVIDALFTYYRGGPLDEIKYRAIREAAKNLARVIDAQCPPGPDRTTAIRSVREAVMTANASIATNNAQYR